MSEAQARSLVAVVATLICAVIAALAWGEWAVLVVFFAALVWLMWDRNTLTDRCDQNADDADIATRGLDDVKVHLMGLEPPSTGRHAHTVMGQERHQLPQDGLNTLRACTDTPRHQNRPAQDD